MGCSPKGVRRVSITDAPVPYRTDSDGVPIPGCPRADNRPEWSVGKAEAGGRGPVPCIVVHIRPVARDEKLLERFCHATGCVFEGDPENPGYWLVVGTPAALEQLTTHKVVLGWHYDMDRREPLSAGSGERKGRSTSQAQPKTVAKEYTRKAQGLE
jgi:hypothetical protein